MVNVTIRTAAALTLAGATFVAGAQRAEQPPVRFKVDVNFVEVDAIVTDRDGRFVADLEKEDFSILEDGKPQAISTFTMVEIPTAPRETAGTRPRVEPDIATNTPEFDGRLFVLVLDDLQTAFVNTGRVRAAAARFAERYVGANDLVAVVRTGGGGGQDFTRSITRVRAAIERFSGSKLMSATQLRGEDAELLRQAGSAQKPVDTEDSPRAHRARLSLGALERTAAWLGGIRGRRKAIVYFGEGIDYDTSSSATTPNERIRPDRRGIHTAMTDLLASATRANVSIYSLDPRGLSVGTEEAIGHLGGHEATEALGPTMSSLVDELSRAQASLRIISETTGGAAFLNRNEMESAFQRIIADSSRYYLLGYYAPSDRRDGGRRQVDVRVTRPGLQVHARRGYLAKPAAATPPPPVGKVSAALREALQSPLAVSGLGLRISAAPFQGIKPDATVAVVVEIDPARLTFVSREGRFDGALELVVAATDAKTGKVTGAPVDSVDLQLRPETHAIVAREGIRFSRRLTLAPGQYRLQVGARDVNSGTVGTAIADLDVPELFAPPLEMSGIAVASVDAGARVPSANEDSLLKDVLPTVATSQREFRAGDTLAAFVEVYANDAGKAYRVAIRTTVTAPDGRVVVGGGEERRTDEQPASAKGRSGVVWGHTATIPLKGLPAGRYVLRMEARRLLTDGGMTARELEFHIR
jgi:VWFA-related protein